MANPDAGTADFDISQTPTIIKRMGGCITQGAVTAAQLWGKLRGKRHCVPTQSLEPSYCVCMHANDATEVKNMVTCADLFLISAVVLLPAQETQSGL